MCHPQENDVCIRNKYVGINATDINITKGRYASVGTKLPFGVGLEGLGEIVEVGSGVKDLKVGQYVAYMNSRVNSYAEYVCVSADEVYPIPEPKPEYLVLLVSGASASIGLDKCARIAAEEKVLVTAAAGGAGHIAVQWAKAAGCYVIGTCSSEEKGKVLKELGCDRVINYKKEDLAEVLNKEFQSGVDIIWETIGGKVFETCVKNLATKGRLIIVGGISSYKSEDSFLPKLDLSFLPELFVQKALPTPQCYVIPNRLNVPYTSCKFVALSGLSKSWKRALQGQSSGLIGIPSMFGWVLQEAFILAKNREWSSEVRSLVEGAVESSLPYPESRSATLFP
ncbi:prostaglandin reductase-3 [Nephila pilipes]|uniref:15-oxoprostaglandin 13-reductase n=1 Tax=Nephila pilipes TaxID=299642 RepID=A0A8X6QUU5_NEPPI|nr:prostaglandin reductase-3 [Nephila pilipes]